MNTEGIDHMLEEHPFFKNMKREFRRLISGCGVNERFGAGSFVFREGSPADKFYIIRHGSVSLEIYIPRRQSLQVDTLGEGNVLGWSWLLPPYHWLLDTRAVQLTRAVSLDAKCLRGKMEQDFELGYELYRRFMPIISEQLHAVQVKLIETYGVRGDQQRCGSS